MGDKNNGKNQDTKKPALLNSKKSLVFSSIAIVLIVAVIAISVIFNIVFANLVPHNIDLTTSKEFSMSDQARDYLKTVNKEVEIVGLFDEVSKNFSAPVDVFEQYVQTNIDRIMEILSQFHLTNNKIKISYVNPDKNVLFLQNKLGAERAQDFHKGDFLVMHGDKVRKVTYENLIYADYYNYRILPNYDSAFVSAIMYVTSEDEHTIGIVTDHGEYSIDDFTLLKKSLENRSYILKEVKLATENLDDYDILLFLGSKQDISTDEIGKLQKYFEDGGNAIFLIEAIVNGKPMNNLNEVLKKYNVGLKNNLIEEDADHFIGLYTFNLYEQLALADDHPLKEMNKSYLIMPYSRSLIELKETLTYLKSYPIVYSSANATSHDYDENKSIKGTNLLGTMVESNATTNTSKIMVMGSTAIATDVTGIEMIVRAVNWMDEAEVFIVPLKTAETAKLDITKSQITMLLIIIGCFILLIFAIGTFIWLRRRHL